MKANKMRLIALMITLAAVMTGINAEAQRRETRSERQQPNVEKRQHADQKSSKREYQKPDYKKDRKYYSERHNKPERQDDHWNRQHQPKSYKHYKYDKRYEYDHPHYGHVYKNFRSKPVRIHHHHGDYYFYGGRYYSHRPGIGYVHVEIPRNLIFVDLPFHCQRVWVGPHVYYRYGDLYFERCDLGYRLAPNVSIHLSARF
jgi:hypothetical protein